MEIRTMKKLETNDWEAFALFSEALKKIKNYKSNRDFIELEDARKNLESTLRRDPTFSRALYHLAILYDLMGEHEDAIENLLKLLKSEYRLEAIYALGSAYFHQYTYKIEAYQKAIKYFNLLLEEIDKSPNDKFKKWCLKMLSHAGLANIYAHLTIKSPSKDAIEHKEIAQKYFDLTLSEYNIVIKELEKAEAFYKQKVPNDINWLILNATGVAYMYKGKRDNDESYIHKAIEKFEDARDFEANSSLYSNLGTSYLFLYDLLKKKDKPQAELYLEKAIKYYKDDVLTLRPDYDFAYYRLAKIYRRRGDFTKGQKYIELAEKNRSEVSKENIEFEKQKIINSDQD